MMGSWSETIMGGDGPMDIECEWTDRGWDKTAPSEQEVNDFIGLERERVQVASVCLMAYGHPISESLRASLIRDVHETKQCVQDWDNPGARLERVRELKEALESYDGTRTEIPREELFDKIAEYFQQKKAL